MHSLFAFLLDGGLSPHGFCLAWQPPLLWLHISSDGIIALAYFGIAAALAIFVHRREDLALGWLFWMFATFILACGLTHIFDIWTLWEPYYGLQGMIKAVTAVASILTALMLWPLIPRLAAVPTPAELRRVRRHLTSAEAALRDTEHRYQILVEGVVDYALFMLDPNGLVTNWNRGAQRINGYTAAEILGKHYETFFTAEDRLSGKPRRALAIAEHEGRYEEEGWRVRQNGTRFYATAVVDALRSESGELLGFTTITRDITERRQTEEALAQAQKMEAIGQLTGGVAHDFNNLLTAVLGSLDLLERRGGIAPEGRRFLDTARQAADRGADLTRRLLAFARRQTLMPKAIDVNALLTGFADLLRRTLGESVAVETVLASDLWLTFADRNQLENALLNLAVNARDAIPTNGKLTIATANEHVALRRSSSEGEVEPGDYVAITVTDTGRGMTEEVRSRAFEPFFTTKPEGRGTGLGLSQVFGFIKQSGGNVTIRSAPGEGTSIRLYLPRHTALTAAPAPAQSASIARVGSGETVLVVEDDPDVRGFSVQAIADIGFTVIAAADASAALRELDAHPEISVMFADIGLPDMDGRSLAAEARRRRPDLRVLLTTAYAREQDVQAGFRRWSGPILAKPFSLEKLARALRQVVGADP